MSSVLLIANPSAGGGRVPKLLPAVRRKLDALGISHRTGLTTCLEDAVALTNEALDRGELPVAFSGDGVAGVVARTASFREGATFGVLPGGTGNDFCGHVGIPQDPIEACDVLRDGVATAIDMGEANGERFLGIASFGYDSLANEAANDAPRWLGGGVYLWGAFLALVRWKGASFKLDVDGERYEFDGWSVVCANTSRYGSGMLIAPDASVEDGRFDLVWTLASGKLRFLASLPRVFKGTHIEDENVRVVHGVNVSVSSSTDFVVYADGDPLTRLPAEIRLIPKAVKVMLPA
ncbi:MAG: YegS/Rv2252/BmrU family lipid kinase [Actinobacteria bacterium]|uniref:Unannotated protein n=1 Tax=freshwater metagenome TaxID=449393 RepID=A0A6J5ZUS0_9ZZZZ|nr:YegS/Rv2252/BmrU family lipid kinase [Actinomycetota bacterium]